MKIYSLSIIISMVLFRTFSYGQSFNTNEFSIAPDLEVMSMTAVADSVDGMGCLFYHLSNKMNFKVINPDGSEKSSFTVPDRQPAFLKLYSSNDKFTAYYLDNQNQSFANSVNIISLGKHDKSISIKKEISTLSRDKNKYVTHFFYSDKIYVLSTSKKFKSLDIRIFDAKGDFVDHAVDVERIPFFFDLIRSGDFRFIHPEYGYSVSDGRFKNKIFLEGNDLYFLVENTYIKDPSNKNRAEILKVDLRNNKMFYSSIVPGNVHYKNTNSSCIIDSLLIRTELSRDNFSISVYNVNTAKLIKKFTHDIDKPFVLNSYGIIKQHELKKKFINITDSEKIKSAMIKGKPSISVVKSNNQLNILVGSYYVPNNYIYAPYHTPFGSGFGLNFWIKLFPNKNKFEITENWKRRWNRSVAETTYAFFETSLSVSDLTIIEPNEEKERTTIFDQAYPYLVYLFDNNVKVGKWIIFGSNSQQLLAFTDKSKKTLSVVSFLDK